MMTEQNGHPIIAMPNPKRVRVRFSGELLADTSGSITLFEAAYPGVCYIPRNGANMTALRRSPHTTRCPFKGLASYYSIVTKERVAENAVWTYEKPLPAACAIAGYLAWSA